MVKIHRKLTLEEILSIILAYVAYMSLFMAMKALIVYWFWLAMIVLAGIVLLTIALIKMCFGLYNMKKVKWIEA